jgi:hypothetical protein
MRRPIVAPARPSDASRTPGSGLTTRECFADPRVVGGGALRGLCVWGVRCLGHDLRNADDQSLPRHRDSDVLQVRELDLAGQLDGPVFEPLRDPELFARVRVDTESGAVAWPTGADLDPIVVYEGLPPLHARIVRRAAA